MKKLKLYIYRLTTVQVILFCTNIDEIKQIYNLFRMKCIWSGNISVSWEILVVYFIEQKHLKFQCIEYIAIK